MNILIGCKLPHGLKFKGSDGEYITLNGTNTSMIDGGVGITHVDEDEWALFNATHSDYQPLLSGAIFTFNTDKVADIAAMAVELEGEKTGFEGLDPTKPAPNLKPEDDKALAHALADKRKPGAAKPKSKADKAAAFELVAIKGDK